MQDCIKKDQVITIANCAEIRCSATVNRLFQKLLKTSNIYQYYGEPCLKAQISKWQP